jgi:hypothetical protein
MAPARRTVAVAVVGCAAVQHHIPRMGTVSDTASSSNL